MKKEKKGSKADAEPQNSTAPVDEEIDTKEVEIDTVDAPKERDIESLQYFFGKRKLEPFDNSEILRCRLLYQLKSSKYKDCYTIVNKNTGKSLGIVPQMQLRHSWRMAHSKDAQKVVKNKLFFMTYEEWQADANKLDKYIKAKRDYYNKENEVLFTEIWSMSETEFESIGLKRPQQFMALLQTAILGEIEETRRTLAAWKRLKKYIHKVPLEASLGGIFSAEDTAKLKARLNVKCLNDIRKQNIFKLKNAMLEFDFEKIVKDINKAYKADLARRKDFRYKVHPFVAIFSNLAIVLYVAYLNKYTLIKNLEMTQLIMLLFSLCVFDTLIVLIGGIRGKRRRLVRPGYVYYSQNVKKTIKWYACIGIFAVLSVLLFYQRYDGYNDKLYYRDLDDGTITVAGVVDKDTTQLTIPDSIDGKSVSEIASYAFHKGNLNEVTIADSVKKINSSAFAKCTSLHKVSMPAGSVEICDAAFKECAVVNLTLPEEGEVSIAKNAFRKCADLRKIENMQSVTSIGDNAFRDCTYLTDFTLSDKLTSMGKKAFMRCTFMTTMEVPSSVLSIGKKAFYYCESLENLAIPFAGTSAEESLEQTIDKIVKFDYPSGERVNVTINSSHPIGNESFKDVVWIASLTLTEDVKSIPSTSFSGTTNLKTVNMTTNVVEIGESAFSGATLLSEVTGANGVTDIASSAFASCVYLESIDLDAIKNIGSGAFASCGTLSAIGALDNLAYVGSNAFNGCYSLKIDIHTKESFTEVASYAFANSGITSFTADDGLTKVDSNAFENCTSLSTVDLPSTVSEIGSYAFYYCSNLKTVDLSKTAVSAMGTNVFTSCYQLSDVSLSKQTASIPAYTFSGCQNFGGLTAIKNISELSIQNIGDSAFENTNSREKLVIPTGVQSIGSRAFASTKVTEIIVPSSVISVGAQAFDNCYYLDVATVPYVGSGINNTSDGYTWTFGATSITTLSITDATSLSGDSLKSGASYINSITLPDGMTTITASLFEGFTVLEKVNIPSTVTTIGNNAFKDCYELDTISIPSGVTSIGARAFENCRQLTYVQIPTGVTAIQDATFKNCTSLRSVNLDNLKLTGIGAEAFMNDTNLSFGGTFNEGLVSVGARAFSGCQIYQAVLAKSTTKLDRDAFGGNVVITIFVTEELFEQYTDLFEKYDNVTVTKL